MMRRHPGFALLLLILWSLCVWTVSAEVLVKVNLEDAGKPLELAAENCSIRFLGKSFLLAQGDAERIAETFPSYEVLDETEPDVIYYLVRVGQAVERAAGSLNDGYTEQSQLERLGRVIIRFGDSVLLRLDPSGEPGLIALGLPMALLPESVKLYTQDFPWMAPGVKPDAEAAVDIETVGEMVSSVSRDKIQEAIYELQENRDLDPPYAAYRSRYSLRVRETDDPSDDACDNAAEYIFNKFRSYGLEVEYDPFPHEVLTQGHYQMSNVVATLPGKGLNSQKTYVISSHYDSIASRSTNWLLNWKTMPAPGADDNASGTAAVLEAARVLSEYDFEYTIKFITFSGEELGLHGSKHYTKTAAENGEEIAGVLNFDMIAYDPDAPDIDVIANMGSEWLADAMLSIQRRYNIGPLLLKKIVNPEMVYSDHAPFWQNGWNAILGIDNSNFESPEFYPFMHTTEDTVDKLNFDLAFRMVQVAVGTLASLADPVGGVPHPDLAVSEDEIFLSPENPKRGQRVQVTANIRNLGEVDAENVLVQVCLVEPSSGASNLADEKFVNLPVDGVDQFSTYVDMTEWGDYEVVVKVNPGFDIFEANGDNNMASKPVHIASTSVALGELMLYPNPVRSSAGGKINISYSLSRDASSRLEIYDSAGKMVYQKLFVGGASGGKFGPNNDIEWDGANFLGEEVSGGVYFCYIVATDGNGGADSASRKFLIIR